MRNRLFSHILPAIIGGFVGIVLFFGFAYSAPKRTLVEASIQNRYRVGFTVAVDCGNGARTRYIGPRKTAILMLDGPNCRIVQKVGR